MSNSLLNSSVIAKEALMQFKNAMGFTKGLNRQYDNQFANKGAQIGDTINIRKPQRFEVSDGATLVIQNVNNETIPLKLDQRKHVGFQFSDQELTLNIEKFSETYLRPAAIALANKVDVTCLGLARKVWNSVGTPGTDPTDIDLALQAKEYLDNMACPQSDRSIVVNPRAQRKMVYGNRSLFHAGPEITKGYREGEMGRAAGFDWLMAQNVGIHTVGPLGGTPLVDVAGQSGDEINLKGWTTAAANRLKAGDVISFTGVNSLNPLTYEDTGVLAQFVVTEDMDSDVSGDSTVKISPAIVLTGPTRNVTGAPADEAPVLIFGHASSYADKKSAMNLAYHKDSIILGCADLDIPKGVDMASIARDPDSGLSMRFVRFYDGINDRRLSRLDILFGTCLAHPEWICRMQG